MRIAIIVNSFPEISEKFLLNAFIGLMEEGVDITVFAAHRSKETHREYIESDLSNRTIYLDIPRSLKKRVLQAPLMFIKLFVKNPKAAIEALNIKKYQTFAKNFKLLWFGNAFNNKHFDVVHCHFGSNGFVGSYLKELKLCKAFFVSFHGSDINTYPTRYGQNVYAHLYKTVDLITVNTQFTGSKVIANGGKPEKIRIHPVGLKPSDYSKMDRQKLEPYSILTVGRLVEKKGHGYLLKALPIVIKKFPKTIWRIAGSGHLEKELKELAKELHIEDHVQFLGLCNSIQVNALYASSTIFVLPSVTAPDGDMEGQGLVLQEAQASGCPVISTLHNGIPDGVLDGKTGYLVPEKDSLALAEKIQFLFSNPEIAKSMGVEAQLFVSQKYDIKNLSHELHGWYKEFFNEKAD